MSYPCITEKELFSKCYISEIKNHTETKYILKLKVNTFAWH